MVNDMEFENGIEDLPPELKPISLLLEMVKQMESLK